MQRFAITLLYCLCLGLTPVSALGDDSSPEQSHDGLKLIKSDEAAAVYRLPGADLSAYDKVALLDAYVAFKKNYKRDYNRDATFEMRLTDKDLARMRDDVADEFRKEFEKALVEKGGHSLVEDQTADGTLVIRPAIIDLNVTAPDKMTAGMEEQYVASAGSMTLYMELYDGPSGQILYRIIDPQAATDWGTLRWANRASNRVAADRILLRWAERLNAHLQNVTTTE